MIGASILGLEKSHELQKQLDQLRDQLQAATRDYDLCEKRTQLRARYAGLFEDFQRDVLAPRRDEIAHLAIGQRDQSARDKLEGRYAELSDLMKTNFQDETDLHNAMMERHTIAGKIVEIEERITKARLREQQKATA